MEAVRSGGEAARRRRRLHAAVRELLRDMRVELSVLNSRVGARLDFRAADLDCLDIISRDGPLSPSALARRSGLHPATVTGVLDRLERDGWTVRERHPTDRRAVVVRAVPDRAAEIYRQYSGMNTAIDKICAGYSEAELDVIADFLRRTTDAGRRATEELPGRELP